MTQPECSEALQGFEEKCLSLGEFFSELQRVTKQRVPVGQGVRATFSSYSFVARQKSKAAGGVATP